VTHRCARRLLAGLPDGLLAPAEERGVRAHLDGCRRCRRRLREFEASEALLRRIPASFIPLDAGGVGHERLQALARWAPAPPARWTRPLPALGACTAAALAIGVMVLVGPAPAAGPLEAPSRRLVVASRSPSSFLAPAVGASATAVPYSWRQ
jgi:RNA polymerase sigma-70 factor (ECF subfamily)